MAFWKKLPTRHVDTGMGFERFVVMQGELQSNYDTDVFQPLIQVIAKKQARLGAEEKADIAMRVIADHLRYYFFLYC